MKITARALVGLAAAATIASFSSFAAAQDHPAGPGAPTAEQREAWKQHREARMHEFMQMRAHRIHDVLNLRPDQDAALQTLLTAMAPPAGEKPGDHKDWGHKGMEGGAAMTTPERLDHMAARMARRQAEFQRRADAIRQFYAVLSPEQKRTFDAVPGLVGGDHHHGMGGHGMGHHGMGGHMGPEGPGDPGHPQ